MSPIKFSTETTVLEPQKETAYAIPVSEWSRLKGKIKAVSHPKSWYQVTYSALFGVSGSAFISAVALLNKDEFKPSDVVFLITLFIGILTILVGGVLVHTDFMQKKDIISDTVSISEEMSFIETRYKTEQ